MSYNQNVQFPNAPLVRLGDYIQRSTANNHTEKYGIELIEGVTNEGIFSTPKGNPMDVDLKPYKIVDNGAFVYNPSRLNLGSIAYRTEGLCIVSHLYIVFYLNDKGKRRINPDWLFMYFRRDEFYREVTFRNFGSQRPEFNFNDMSDILIPLPDISVQQKYVDIYKAMIANQQSYERGLEDLKLAIDGTLDQIKTEAPQIPLGELLAEIDNRNSDKAQSLVYGVTMSKQFIPSVANLDGVDISKYKLVATDQIACNFMHVGRDKSLPLAINQTADPLVVSPAYFVFEKASELCLPEYIVMWLSREESGRYCWFISDSSVRGGFSLEQFYSITIPVPSIDQQHALTSIYNSYITRKEINDKMKMQIKSICPILIKGSLEEE